jgi:hypothetical protein
VRPISKLDAGAKSPDAITSHSPDKPTHQYNDQAVTVAKLLQASGHTPDVVAYCALRVIAKRLPDLTFDDFVSGSMLAIAMSEAASPDEGHA